MCVINIIFLSQHLGTGGLPLSVVCRSVFIPYGIKVESLKLQKDTHIEKRFKKVVNTAYAGASCIFSKRKYLFRLFDVD